MYVFPPLEAVEKARQPPASDGGGGGGGGETNRGVLVSKLYRLKTEVLLDDEKQKTPPRRRGNGSVNPFPRIWRRGVPYLGGLYGATIFVCGVNTGVIFVSPHPWRCAACGKVYSGAHHEELVCPRAKACI